MTTNIKPNCKCARHGSQPFHFICKDLVKRPTQTWVLLGGPERDGREVEADYCCLGCLAKIRTDKLTPAEVTMICMTCVKPLREHATGFYDSINKE